MSGMSHPVASVPDMPQALMEKLTECDPAVVEEVLHLRGSMAHIAQITHQAHHQLSTVGWQQCSRATCTETAKALHIIPRT